MEIPRPLVCFRSGEVLEWAGEKPIEVNKKRKIRLAVIMTDEVKRKYSIPDEKLHRFDYIAGEVFVFDYPVDYIHKTIGSESMWVYCGLLGEEYYGDDLLELRNELSRRDKLISQLKSENQDLLETLMEKNEVIRSLGGKEGI